MYFQMQPFDLLGITIKSLAEIEKEVSKLPRMGQVGSRSSLAGPTSPFHIKGVFQGQEGTSGWGGPLRKTLSLKFTSKKKKLTF